MDEPPTFDLSNRKLSKPKSQYPVKSWTLFKVVFWQTSIINQSNFYSANISIVARLSGATSKSVSNSKIDEAVPQRQQVIGHVGVYEVYLKVHEKILCVSWLSVVENQNGKFRPIVSLRRLNYTHYRSPKYRYTDIETANGLVESKDHLVTRLYKRVLSHPNEHCSQDFPRHTMGGPLPCV